MSILYSQVSYNDSIVKVLIVEDNYILAKNITKYLHLQGIDGDFVRT